MLDVGHNEPAVEALLQSVSAAWGAEPLVLIFGANFDKDVRKIVELISAQPALRRVVAVQSSHPKAVPTDKIVEEVAGRASAGVWREAPSMLDALDVASEALGPESAGTVLCCGSVFVVADMRAALAAKAPTLFRKDDWAFEEAGEPPLLM